MAPFHLEAIAGTLGYNLVYLALGGLFGAVLEISGFGDSRKLAAQFYLRELTVLKVMFTGIIVAAALIFAASAFELLDFSRVWVNPTYLAPGIVGGLIMGVGFIIGGFCPGTSLVAASTLKLDGVMFVLGVGFGVFLFGESVQRFEGFYSSTFMGRFTIADWLGLPHGVVVALVVLMALTMFWGGEIAEAYFGRGTPFREIPLLPRSKAKVAAAGVLLALCAVMIARGQPDVDARWRLLGAAGERQLAAREVFVDPAEVVELKRDLSLSVRVLDLRPEADYNLFHVAGARRIAPADARGPALAAELLAAPDNMIFFLASNGEDEAVRAWKALKAQGAVNLYVIAGGINRWLDLYPPSPCVARRAASSPAGEALHYTFAVAVGEQSPSAHPDVARREFVPDCALAHAPGVGAPPTFFDGANAATREYQKKVKLQKKTAAKGGCG